jgi:N-acetylglucosaminyl-diphospho-decaprenol L-rhamnosyltransferase
VGVRSRGSLPDRTRCTVASVALVDVVIVSYNSRDGLRACVEPLAAIDAVHVVVADNASADGSLGTVADLPITRLPLASNGGFAHGSNAGWRTGGAPYVLLLNPDAVIEEPSIRALVRVLEADSSVGAVGPQIRRPDGSFEYSIRRFPRLRSTYSQALFLHRLFPLAAWTDELVRDEDAYMRPCAPDWVTGACILVRREALERLGGLDEGFFLYCEDIDLCRRIRTAGWSVRYAPDAVAVHVGGASAPRPGLFPVLAESRVRYARKHRGRCAAALERLGITLEALTHMVLARGGLRSRAGHARALRRIALSTTSTAR